eukprot:gene9139-14164_t
MPSRHRVRRSHQLLQVPADRSNNTPGYASPGHVPRTTAPLSEEPDQATNTGVMASALGASALTTDRRLSIQTELQTESLETAAVVRIHVSASQLAAAREEGGGFEMECTVTCPDGHERELRVTWHEPASRLAADARLSAATLRLLQESFGDDGFETEDDLYVAALRCLDADKCVWVTAEAGPDLVGVLAVSPYGGSVLVLNMCVAPAYRSIGLARFLLREGQKMAVRATPPLHRVSGHVRRDNARLLTMYAGFGALPSQ